MKVNINSNMHYLAATIRSMRQLTTDYYLLVINSPPIADLAYPGQFVQLRVAEKESYDPLLARPISIMSVDVEKGDISLLFKVVGRGTALLANFKPDNKIVVQGPIGKGFSLPKAAKKIALVAGGVGMPPLFFLAEQLQNSSPDSQITLYYGGRSQQDLLLLPEWRALGVEVNAATDDGSFGYHGLVTEPLQHAIARKEVDYIAACGPQPMLRAVQRIALAANITGQLSLEAHMACGVGACLGCVCETKAGRRRVCVDGPIFQMNEVLFDE